MKGKAKIGQDKSENKGKRREDTGKDQTWEKPPDGWVKCNVDASFLTEDRRDVCGTVLRDYNGTILTSAWDVINHCQTIEMGKAIACLQGLKLAIANSISNIVIETDCAPLPNIFNEVSSNRFKVCLIANEFNLLRLPERHIVISSIKIW
jgi:hypothetical protein